MSNIAERGRRLRSWILIAAGVGVSVAAFLLVPAQIDTYVNPIFWILSNVLVGYSAITLTVYTLFYYFFFNWQEYPGSRRIMRFLFSLLGVIVLVAISIFLNPQTGREWYAYPADVFIWRPFARALVYSGVALSTTGLFAQLIYRYRRGLRLEIQADPRIWRKQSNDAVKETL